MSKSLGKIKFNDGHVVYAIFDNSTEHGIMLRSLYMTHDEASEHRSDRIIHENQPELIQGHHPCSCGADEEVELATDYGRGMHWNGRACRYCNVITQHLAAMCYSGERLPWWTIPDCTMSFHIR